MPDTEQPTLVQRVVRDAFFFAVIGISALGTAAFFLKYVDGLIPEAWVQDPLIRSILTAIIGVVILDVGALAWRHILHQDGSHTPRQLQIAQAMSTLCAVLASLLSVSWFVLSMGLINDANVMAGAGLLGVIVVITAVSVQFMAAWLYGMSSVEAEYRRLVAVSEAQVRAAYASRLRANLRDDTEALVEDAIDHNQSRVEDAILRKLKHGGAGRKTAAAPTATMARTTPTPAHDAPPKVPRRRNP